MTISKEFKRTSILRRVAAAAIDIIIAFIFFVIILTFIINPCFESFSDYGKKYQEYISMCEDSHLYTVDGSGNINDLYGENYIKKDEALTYFYTHYSSIDKLNEEKEKRKDLFTYVNGEYVYAKNKDADLGTFYNEQYEKALNIFNDLEDVKKINAVLGNYQLLMVFLSAFISLALVLFIPPIIFKNGQTIGKKWLHIQLVSKKTGERIHWPQWVIRTSIYFVVEILLSLYSFGVPLLVNAIFTIANKAHLGIHDVLCSTIPVDVSFYDPSNLRENDRIIISYIKDEEVKENG